MSRHPRSRWGILILLLLAAPLMAGTYYIAPGGNDANNGTINAPWRTITSAIRVAKGGDVLYLRGGTYTEDEVWIRSDEGLGGSKDRFLTISAYPGETPIFTSSNRPFLIDANWVRVQGLDFRNGKEMAIVSWHGIRRHVELINNRFSGTASWAPIEASGDSLLIEGNTIKLEGNTVGTQGHGIYLSRGSHNIIRGNTISGMVGYGIHVFDQRRSEDGPNATIRLSGILLEGNTIFDSQERAGIIVSTQDIARADSIVIRNNTLYHHAGSGIVIQASVTNVRIYNNTIYSVNTDHIGWTGSDGIYIGANENGTPNRIVIRNNIIVPVDAEGGHIRNEGGTNLSVDHNLYWSLPANLVDVEDTHPVKADPLFVAPQTGDFTLQKSSPAIDAGVQVGLPFSGPAPDLGAHEYGVPADLGVLLFRASFADGLVRLEWQAANAESTYGFDVERSPNNLDYVKTGFVPFDATAGQNTWYHFEEQVPAGETRYCYRLKTIALDGTSGYSDPVWITTSNPESFALQQNYPNPFALRTEISYALPKSAHVVVAIYNVAGQEIVQLVNREEERGVHRVVWNGLDLAGKNLASGLYICKLTSSTATATRKIALLR